MSNIQILIVNLEMKEKERFELSKNIGDFSNKVHSLETNFK